MLRSALRAIHSIPDSRRQHRYAAVLISSTGSTVLARTDQDKVRRVEAECLSPLFSIIIGFSQLSDMEFFVDPKNEMSETEIHPLCGWE